MRFSELENVRVKLDKEGKEEFWHRVDEFGGVMAFAEAFEISPSKMYNWKSKESYIPVELVRKVFGSEASQHVKAYKGSGRSKPVENPVFPIPENDELLTRIQCSVTTNKNGIPVYQASDRGRIERFAGLLRAVGDVPYQIYERDIFELRYPKYLHRIFNNMSYEESLDALVDEEAMFEGDRIILDGDKIDPKTVDEVHHRDKKVKLALMKQDNKEIAKLMLEEKEKVRKALN